MRALALVLFLCCFVRPVFAINTYPSSGGGLPSGGTVGQTIVNTAPGTGTWQTPIFSNISGNIVNSQLATMGNNTVLGNVSGITTTPTALTTTQLTTLINAFTSSLSGAVPPSGGGTTNFLRADGTFAAPGGGGGSSSALTSGNVSAVISQPQAYFNGGLLPTIPSRFFPTNGPIQEYIGTGGDIGYQDAAVGSDGNIWISGADSGDITRITPSGTITNFAMSGAENPLGLCLGSNGNIFVGDSSALKLFQVTPSGSVTSTNLSTFQVFSLCSGPDGNLYCLTTTQTVVKMTTSFSILATYSIPGAAQQARYICFGPDGNAYFTTGLANQIIQMTPTGTFTAFNPPTGSSNPVGICPGPDGRLWFCESGKDKIGAMTTSGVFSEYAVTASSQPFEICCGSDSILYFTEATSNKIGRMTTSGVLLSETSTPTGSSQPQGICSLGGIIYACEYEPNPNILAVYQPLLNQGIHAFSGPLITKTGSVSGTLYWSMPEQGPAYKKVTLVLASYHDAGESITFPTAFSHTPAVTGNTTGLTISTISTSSVTLPAANTSGVIVIEGI